MESRLAAACPRALTRKRAYDWFLRHVLPWAGYAGRLSICPATTHFREVLCAMAQIPDWWQQPRSIAIVSDEGSWMRPHVEVLRDAVRAGGDEAEVHDDPGTVPGGGIVFYLGCGRVVPASVLGRHRRNLVVHASDLPRGRGWSPWTWSILAGGNRIPLCLFEAVEEVDAGPVIYREWLEFAGHELLNELRDTLGARSIDLCRRFLGEESPPAGEPQAGEPDWLPRRRPGDSRIDPQGSLAEQFDLLRVVDNDRYPAFFDWRGHRYRLRLDKLDPGEGDDP